MTISSSVSKATLNGDGVQTEFPFAFKVWMAGNLEVSITSPAGANTVVGDWTVELAGIGGTVTYPTAGDPLPLGWMITIRRFMDFLQDVDLVSGTRFDPEVIETALDIATAERQQLLEEISRTVRVGVASGEDPANVVNQVFEARDAAEASMDDAAAQVLLAEGWADAAALSALAADGFADAAALSALAADGFADDAEQSALDAIAAVNSAAFTNLPIGTLVWHTGTTAFPGSVVADGEIRSRAAFPDLWAFAQTSGNISVNDASWTFGQYSPGDGATTFRVPKVDDRFIRGKSATRAVGLVEEDAFQGHWHSLQIDDGDSTAGGYLSGSRYPNSAVNRVDRVKRAVSDGINGTPRTADETRPKALTMLPCIKAYDVISDPNVLNAVGVVNEISRLESEKLRKDENINLGVSVPASGTAVDFVGIPEGVKRITVMFDRVSTNGSSVLLVQLGGGTLSTSGYFSNGMSATNGQVSSSVSSIHGFISNINGSAASTFYGSMTISKSKASNTFIESHLCNRTDNNLAAGWGSGYCDITNVIDRIRITTVNGTDQFDAGTINISWEF